MEPTRPGVASSRGPRTAGILLAGFLAANAFLLWSAGAWFHPFGPATVLVNPFVDKWLIVPLAIAAWAVQLPTFGLFDYLEELWEFGIVESIVIASLLSTALYTPVVLWIQIRRRKAR
jgi:hypothetical protein